MSKFINNVNKYLSEMKIKQTYLSMTSGIDKNKLSRLLTGVQEESGTDDSGSEAQEDSKADHSVHSEKKKYKAILFDMDGGM